MLSKLTLIGMHNYSNGAIWDNVLLPEGIDKELLINEILKSNGEFCLIYPDMDFLKMQIELFFRKWYSNFNKWITVLNSEYEPLFNVDVKTSFEEHGENEDNSEKNGLNNNSRNTSASGSSNGSSNNTTERSKAAYDASTYQPTEREVSSGITSLNSSETGSETGSATSSESMTANSEHTITTEEYKRGNQGVTMSQEMLLAELNVRRFNLYDQIADIFASEFCITLYV